MCVICMSTTFHILVWLVFVCRFKMQSNISKLLAPLMRMKIWQSWVGREIWFLPLHLNFSTFSLIQYLISRTISLILFLSLTGRYLTMLPMEPKLGKMLILGAIFNCLDPVLTIVAGLSVRDPFLTPFDKKDVSQLSSHAFCLLVGSETKNWLIFLFFFF
jgi:hypothetical protein